MRERAARAARGALCASALALSASTAATTTGCFTNQCDGSEIEVGGPDAEAGTSLMALPDGEVLWESSPQTGPWIDFAPMRTVNVTFPVPFMWPPDPSDIGCQIAFDFTNPKQNSVPCGGNLAQFENITATGMTVLNPNCAHYGLLLTVRGFPAAGGAGDAESTQGGDAEGGAPQE